MDTLCIFLFISISIGVSKSMSDKILTQPTTGKLTNEYNVIYDKFFARNVTFNPNQINGLFIKKDLAQNETIRSNLSEKLDSVQFSSTNSKLINRNMTESPMKTTRASDVKVRGELLFSNGDGISSLSRTEMSGLKTVRQSSRVAPHPGVSKSLSHLLWDTMYIVMRCIKDLWGSGSVVDCVKERTGDVFGRFFGYGTHEKKRKRTDEFLRETPRIPNISEDWWKINKDMEFSGRKKKNKHTKHILQMMSAIIKMSLLVMPFFLFLKFKAVVLVAFGVASLVLLSGKAFLLGIVSFALSVIAALRNSVDTSSPPHVEEINLVPHRHHRRDGVDPLFGGRQDPNFFM